MKKLLNCTGHPIDIELIDGTFYRVPASGIMVRQHSIDINRVFRIGKIPVSMSILGDVIGLPQPAEGVIYIVSTMALQALNGSRPDVFAPGELIRDEKGKVLGCRGLKQI